ncbi:CBS domain-containing protein [Natronobeatus ordinarius]|uniref:CBS domain-containing protein n=1 Tax=Natronobeatus ordinarius TaxID=2963433 RepID=UPI0020CC62D0|nr:CBS domain-containing protein [Natronobeatus ordinarius]
MYETIPVSEIMVTDVATATPTETAAEAARTVRDRNVGSVVVVDGEEPVGILTEGDFARHLCERSDLGHVELEAVMSMPVVTIAPDASIVEAAEMLRRHQCKHLPVVANSGEADELRGIVTTTELTYYIPQLMHPPAIHDREPKRLTVRTDTQYERDDWSFEYHGEDETQVSVGDVAIFGKRLSESDVESFAEVTGDTNRLHLEASYAAATRFGERIVHGVLGVGLISAALARLPGLSIYLSQEISFRGPVGVGERATARCEIVDDLGGSKFRVETTVLDESEEPVLEGEAVVLVDELPPEGVLEGEATA